MSALEADLLTVSRAKRTWITYHRHWRGFRNAAHAAGLSLSHSPLTALSELLGRTLIAMWYSQAYKFSSILQYKCAIASQFRELRGEIVTPKIRRILEGIRRKVSDCTVKKAPLLAHHLAQLIRMPPPVTMTETTWTHTVIAMVLSWLGFLRWIELQRLQLCSIAWGKHQAVITIRQTKADQGGTTTQTLLRCTRQGFCPLSWVKAGLLQLHHGSLARHPQCTANRNPGWECKHCSYLLPGFVAGQIDPKKQYPYRTGATAFKHAFHRLENMGHLPKGMAQQLSTSSCRRGAATTAASQGIRAGLVEEAGRWGLAGRKRRGEARTAMLEYESTTPSELWLVPDTLAQQIAQAYRSTE